MSARLLPLLFQSTTRCHSVFSCCSPCWFFQRRLVASDSVATRDPLAVLRTSGSAPRFPINVTLFKLRLTRTSTLPKRSNQGGPADDSRPAGPCDKQTDADRT